MILRRLEGSRFSEVLPAWHETAVILAGGPSLTAEMFERVRAAHAAGKVRCIAVNDSYLQADFADGMYGADASWHRKHGNGVDKPRLNLTAHEVAKRYRAFAGWRCSVEDQMGQITDDAIHILRRGDLLIRNVSTMDPQPELVAGRNSGHQAMNIAIKAGAKRILLCGFDAKDDERNGKMETHWHGGHGHPLSGEFYRQMRVAFSAAESLLRKLGVTVINCSAGSAIDTFEKASLEDCI